MNANFPIDDDVIFSSENQAVVASRMHRQHVNVAVASAVVSAIVHVLLLIYMIVSPPNLGMSSSRPNQRDDVERERCEQRRHVHRRRAFAAQHGRGGPGVPGGLGTKGATIARFDPTLLCLASKQRPKRLWQQVQPNSI